MESPIPTRLATLGHPQRLALFRLLMRRHPDRVPATRLAEALGVKPNTLSTYVNALMQAGLVTQERHGTSLHYGIALDTVRETFDYLLLDCCRGRPDLCAPPAPRTSARPRVLFLCTGNATRSILAESLLRHTAGYWFEALSAGTHPRAAVTPAVLDLLLRHGHDTTGLYPKHRATLPGPFDFVFTLCDRAANEDCAPLPGQPIATHWSLPDPSRAPDPERALHQTFATLAHRIAAFTALPTATLDPVALQRAVDDIARLPTPEPA